MLYNKTWDVKNEGMDSSKATYSLEPLHSNQEMIDDTIKLLKEEWPDCLAERLKLVETSQCKGLPCSLVFTESREGAGKEVLGHARLVQALPECERRIYIESVTIKKGRRGQGLGRKLHDMLGDYAKRRLNARHIHLTTITDDTERFYRHLNFDSNPVFVPPITANVLRTFPKLNWEGNVIPEEWKYLYEGQGHVTEEDRKKYHFRRFMKDLGEL